MNCNVLYFEPSLIRRLGMKVLLENQPEFNINIEVQSTFSLVKFTCKKTNIFLINLSNLDKGNIESLIGYIQKTPNAYNKIIVMANDKDIRQYGKLLNGSVSGLIHTDADKNQILNCFEQTQKGNRYIASCFYNNSRNIEYSEIKYFDQLTRKEKEIVELICFGKSSVEIANLLCNSARTIDAHRRNIALKLDMQGPGKLSRFLSEHKEKIALYFSRENYTSIAC